MIDKMVRHIARTEKAHRWLKPFALLVLNVWFCGAALAEWAVTQPARAWQAAGRFWTAFRQCREQRAERRSPLKGKPFRPSYRPALRAVAVALSVCMVFTAMPQTAFAAEAPTGLCEHHEVHTIECRYVEAVEGQTCAHEHRLDCYTDELICGLEEDVTETASGSDADHTHTQDCYALDCPHENGEHDKDCGYIGAVEGTPCGNVCELCGEPVDSGNSGGGSESITLVAFDGLEEVVERQSVPVGTPLEELVLPETLSATVQTGDESLESVTVPDVTWEPDVLYEGAVGNYDFTASAAGYACAEGVDWPVIIVTVEETVPDELDTLCAAIDALPTVEELTDNAPGNADLEYDAWVTETRAMLESVPALWEQFLVLSEDAAMERITNARASKLAGLNDLAGRLGGSKTLAEEPTPTAAGYNSKQIPVAHTHSWDTAWTNDATHHWHNCGVAGCGITANADKEGYGTHSEDNGTVTKEPTELEDGIRTYKCSVCDYEMRTETIEKLPPPHAHSWATAWTNDATYHWHNCGAAGCGIIANADKEGYGAHTEDRGTVTKEPTELEDGTRTYNCIVCGYVMRMETIPATGQAATVTGVSVTPAMVEVQKGGVQQFNVAVTGTNNPAQAVNWSLVGSYASGTSISATGLLTVASEEAQTAVTVKATSIVDTSKSGTAAVTVIPVAIHTITASAGTGGTISPSGAVTVNEGESQTFTITPNSNYRISQVIVDDADQGAVAAYAFENVTAAHSISVTFRYIGESSGGSSGGDGGSSSDDDGTSSGSGSPSSGGSSSIPSTTTSTTAGENGTSTTTTQTTSKDSSGKTTTVTTEIIKDATGNTTGSTTTVTTDNITASTDQGSSTVTVKPDAAAIGGAAKAAGASETNPMDVSVEVPQDTVKNELQKADVSTVHVEVVIPKAVEDNPAVRTAGVTVEKETVEAARQAGKNVTVTVREETGAVKAVWSLDGQAMGNTAGQSTDLNLGVHTAPVQSGDPIAAPVKPPVTAAGQENGLVISLTVDGTLLSAAKLTVPATNQTAITAGSTVALYRFDPNTGVLSAVPGGVYSVDANGNVTIDVPAGTRTGEKETYVLLPVPSTAQPAADAGGGAVHTVKAGDTLNQISRQYGCQVEDLLALNPGLDIYNLQIGSGLRVR